LQRIVMSMRVVAVDLSKPRHSLLGFPVPEEPESGLVPNCLPEGQLGSRKEAHSDSRFTWRSEPARNRVSEAGSYELITDFCRSGRDLVQTVVTHGRYSCYCNRARRVLPKVTDQSFVAVLCRSGIYCRLTGTGCSRRGQ